MRKIVLAVVGALAAAGAMIMLYVRGPLPSPVSIDASDSEPAEFSGGPPHQAPPGRREPESAPRRDPELATDGYTCRLIGNLVEVDEVAYPPKIRLELPEEEPLDVPVGRGGVFSQPLRRPLGAGAEVVISAAGFADVTVRPRATANQTWNARDVPLFAATNPVFLLRRPDGSPFSGDVLLQKLEETKAEGFRVSGLQFAKVRTNELGAGQSPYPISRGEWKASITGCDVAPPTFVVSATTDTVRLTLTPLARILGTVYGPDGQPIEGAVVAAQDNESGADVGRSDGISAADGTFAVVQRRRSDAPVRLVATVPGKLWRGESGPWAWGDTSANVAIARPLAVRLRVARSDGRLVTGGGIVAVRGEGRERWSEAFLGSNGEWIIPRADDRPIDLMVLPHAEQYGVATVHGVQPSMTRATREVTVPDATLVEVCVSFSNGNPTPKAEIAIINQGGIAIDAAKKAPLRYAINLHGWGGETVFKVAVGETNDDGRTMLRIPGPPHSSTWTILVRSQGSYYTRDVVLGELLSIQIPLPRSVFVRVDGHTDYDPGLLRMSLATEAGGRLLQWDPEGRAWTGEVQSDGAAAVRPLVTIGTSEAVSIQQGGAEILVRAQELPGLLALNCVADDRVTLVSQESPDMPWTAPGRGRHEIVLPPGWYDIGRNGLPERTILVKGGRRITLRLE